VEVVLAQGGLLLHSSDEVTTFRLDAPYNQLRQVIGIILGR
jgi:hypothetical protein